VFVYPLTALINLFIYVIQHPQHPNAQADITLMYLAAGHFSYLEFAISDMTFPFVRHLANLARSTVSKARDKSLPKSDVEPRLDAASLSLNQDQLDLGPIYDVSCRHRPSSMPQ